MARHSPRHDGACGGERGMYVAVWSTADGNFGSGEVETAGRGWRGQTETKLYMQPCARPSTVAGQWRAVMGGSAGGPRGALWIGNASMLICCRPPWTTTMVRDASQVGAERSRSELGARWTYEDGGNGHHHCRLRHACIPARRLVSIIDKNRCFTTTARCKNGHEGGYGVHVLVCTTYAAPPPLLRRL